MMSLVFSIPFVKGCVGHSMTNSKIFDEIGCPDELKKCRDELKRHKKHIERLSNQLLDYERIIEEKENEIIVIKNK